MGKNYLIDTNIGIYLMNGSLNSNALRFIEPIIDDTYHLSVITKIELLGFAFADATNLSNTREFVNDSIVISLTDAIVEQTIQLRQRYKMKLPDAVIAATAIVHNFTLISRNDKDFSNINELQYFNPF